MISQPIEIADQGNDLLTLVGVFVAAAIPVWFGARAFFMQKEHELVHQRYLKGGFDELIATGERALNSHNHNWSHALNVLKILRDVPTELNASEVAIDQFLKSDQILPYAAAGRVIRATQSRAPWDALQLIISFSNRSYEFCAIEVSKIVKAFLENRANASGEEIALECSNHLKKLMFEADVYSNALGEINVLAIEFETSRFNFKSMSRFPERAEVQSALAKLIKFVEEKGPAADDVHDFAKEGA